MQSDKTLNDAISKLTPLAPVSIFVYGSRGRGDGRPDSDYELGVVFDDAKYVHFGEVQAAVHQLSAVRAYPFRLSELRAGTFESPFQKAIFRRELAITARTVHGDRIVESLTPPPITTLDLIQRIRFDLGYALAAVLSERAGDMPTATDEFSKSCLFGVRCLEILKLRTFPSGYEEIHRLATQVVADPEHLAAIDAASEMRLKSGVVSVNYIFDNISLLNFVENVIVKSFQVSGSEPLI